MKKLFVLTMLMLSLVGAGFAKSIKISEDKLVNMKSVVKAADSLGLEVIENSENYFVAKDDSNIAIFYKEYYDDGSNVQFACVILDSDVLSKTIYEEDNKKYSLTEDDEEIQIAKGVNFDDLDYLLYTMNVMNMRNNIRRSIAEEQGLKIPVKTRSNDASFRQAYDANIDEINAELDNDDTDSGVLDLINKVVRANFATN